MSNSAVRLKSKEISKLGLDRSRYHILFCGGPDCCSRREGEHLWDFLKQQVKTLDVPVLRTQVKCLRICHSGPWMVVYPEGTWYGNLTLEKMAHILEQHVLQGTPVTEWASLTHPLPQACTGTSPD